MEFPEYGNIDVEKIIDGDESEKKTLINATKQAILSHYMQVEIKELDERTQEDDRNMNERGESVPNYSNEVIVDENGIIEGDVIEINNSNKEEDLFPSSGGFRLPFSDSDPDFNNKLGQYIMQNKDKIKMKSGQGSFNEILGKSNPTSLISTTIMGMEGTFTAKDVYDKVRPDISPSIHDFKLKAMVCNIAKSLKLQHIISQDGDTYKVMPKDEENEIESPSDEIID